MRIPTQALRFLSTAFYTNTHTHWDVPCKYSIVVFYRNIRIVQCGWNTQDPWTSGEDEISRIRGMNGSKWMDSISGWMAHPEYPKKTVIQDTRQSQTSTGPAQKDYLAQVQHKPSAPSSQRNYLNNPHRDHDHGHNKTQPTPKKSQPSELSMFGLRCVLG
jgi:hypothetical protein